MDLHLVFSSEVLFWSVFILAIAVSASMRIQRNSHIGGKKLSSMKDRNYDVQLGCDVNFKNDEHRRRSTIIGGRGDKDRNTLREIRKHQRSMKLKCKQNRDDLRYYCFYKGITEKYYSTLRQC